MITKRPITPEMVLVGGQALWDQHRDIEGRVHWDDAMPWAREPYELKARIVLETAIPQEAKFLRAFGDECYDVAEIL